MVKYFIKSQQEYSNMILRVLFALLFNLSLYGASDSWYSKVNTTLEVGIFLPTINGSITNIEGPSDFQNDLAFSTSKATYISADFQLHQDYIPNIYFGYFNMQANASASLTKTIRVATVDFNSSVFSQIDYQVFNALLYKDFKLSGKMMSLFGKAYYSGDLEFDIGLNTKLFMWKYQIQDLSKSTQAPSWIEVNELIPLPYFGVKYHLYNLKVYTDISTLAFSNAKSTSYQYGLSYRVVDGLYLSAAYFSEEFEVVENLDIVEFQTDGYKFSFKYAF
jgi:hypothetical protein